MTAKTVTSYKCGFLSGAGYPVLYDRSYTLDDARAKAAELGRGTRVFKVTIEEVL